MTDTTNSPLEGAVLFYSNPEPLDPALPREVIRHELPADQRVCPHDGAALREIGVEASEQLDIIPQQLRVIRHERVKYACPCCDGAIRLGAGRPW